MRYGPPVAFTRNASGTTIAYQVLGEGPLDLVFMLGWPSHLALLWEHPAPAGFLHRLASFSRLILFDRPGTGMSDRGPTGRPFEEWMDDVRTVMAAVGSERAAFFGCHLGGRLALLFAATHPERTAAVVAFAAHPATLRDDDYPWGTSPEERSGLLDGLRSGGGDRDQLLRDLARRLRRRGHPPLVHDVHAFLDEPAGGHRRHHGDRPGRHPGGAGCRPGADPADAQVGRPAGECEVVGDHVRGIAVHIAARVMALAEGGETLCSRTVKDLVAGSGFRFSDRGRHRLKGVDDEWQLYEAEVAAR